MTTKPTDIEIIRELLVSAVEIREHLVSTLTGPIVEMCGITYEWSAEVGPPTVQRFDKALDAFLVENERRLEGLVSDA